MYGATIYYSLKIYKMPVTKQVKVSQTIEISQILLDQVANQNLKRVWILNVILKLSSI